MSRTGSRNSTRKEDTEWYRAGNRVREGSGRKTRHFTEGGESAAVRIEKA